MNINIDWDNVELLSLDIFDTLLFRAVEKPIDIFRIVWDRAKEAKINKIDIAGMEYQKLRIEMEKRARNNSANGEVVLQDIYSEMPTFIAFDKEKLLQAELEVEKEYCYANDEIYQLIEIAKRKNIKVILTSDMYLSSCKIKEILTYNCIDADVFDAILVSCEYGCNKQNGALYQEIFKKYSYIRKEKILHIGDNINSDYKQAMTQGLQAIHYDVIPDTIYSIYDYERIRHDVPLPDLLALRKVASKGFAAKTTCGYEIGASIVGPFLSLYISWVVARMEILGIRRIYPLMREGYLLGELLKREAKYRNIELIVKPIYISRKVAYIPSIKKVNREEIENMIGARNLTIQEALSLMGLSTEGFEEFKPYFKFKLKETHEKAYEKTTLKEAFIERMLRPENIQRMERHIIEQRQLLNDYLRQELGNLKNAATIDIGFFGRIQMWMEQSLANDSIETDLTHFLAIGLTGDKIYNGIHFEGYCSTTTENTDLVTTIHRTTDVLEKLISVSEGSTIGYERNNDRVEPIKGVSVKNSILQDVFAGILEYQRKWFEFQTRKKELAQQCTNNRRGALMILHRLIDMPRKAEAELFTTVEADTNFGTNYSECVITKENMELLHAKGKDYIDKCNVSYTYENSNVVWPKGLITLEDEFYYVRKALKEKSQNEIMRAMQEVVEHIQKEGIKAVALYGAGENGRQFYFICSLYGIQVNCYIDRKESIWGTQKEGIPIMGLREAMDRGNEIFIVTSLFSISEISSFIKQQFKEASKIPIIYSV